MVYFAIKTLSARSEVFNHTDHNLFNRNTAVLCNSSVRICRWAAALLPYDHDMVYFKGTDILRVDAMSCLPLLEYS